MNDVTRILVAIEQGEPQAAERLLPLVYDELRKFAAQKLAREKPGQTLEATALVHEAYLRLVDPQAAGRRRSACRSGDRASPVRRFGPRGSRGGAGYLRLPRTPEVDLRPGLAT